MVTAAFTCSPPQGFWLFETNPNCMDDHLVFVISASQNLFLDVFVLALPAWMIPSLKLTLLHKLAVLGTFCVGILYVVPYPRALVEPIRRRKSPRTRCAHALRAKSARPPADTGGV